MSEIHYRELNAYLKTNAPSGFSSVYLIFGEEMLCKSTLELLVSALLPALEKRTAYEVLFDESDEVVYDVIERVNTFSWGGRKVIALCDSRIFYSKEDGTLLLKKAKEAYDQQSMKKAARHLMSLLSLQNLSFDDIRPINRSRNLTINLEEFGDDRWIDELIAFCKDNRMPLSEIRDSSGDLQRAIEKGFPEGNHLLITTDTVNKSKGLYKAIFKHGTIIDCSVPKGDRKADRQVQEAMLQYHMKILLSKSQKTIHPMAFQALYDLTGFDLRTFTGNIEKLISYVGNREEITVDDVNEVLERTKQDPIYELTNAVSNKNTADALFFLDSLLSSGFLPLSILGAIANQIRKLLIIKDFTQSTFGGKWKPGMIYEQFQNAVMPSILEYDKQLLAGFQEWATMFQPDPDSEAAPKDRKEKKKKKSAAPATNLIIAKNPNNPYPVYLQLVKSERFTIHDLLDAMEQLSNADMQLKSTGRDPKLILEEAIFRICGTGRRQNR